MNGRSLLSLAVVALLAVQAGVVVTWDRAAGPATDAARLAANRVPTAAPLAEAHTVLDDSGADEGTMTARVGAGLSSGTGPRGAIEVEVGLPEPRPRRPDPACGADDLPETGIQGDVPLVDQQSGRARQGYNCGLAVVGYSSLGGRGANANMAWSGHCAYVAGEGVAVVDVSDPTSPTQVGLLTSPGSRDALETLHAVDAGDRSVLVVGRYGLFFNFQPPADSAPVDVYDVSDCEHPRLLSTIDFPQSVHNLRLSTDARTLWGTLPLQAFDLADPAAPRFLGNLEDQLRAQGVTQLEYAHEAVPAADGTRLYIGGQIPGDESSMIIDIEGWPQAAPRLVSRFDGPGHSISPATIDGRDFLLRSDESVLDPTANGCLPDLTPVGGVAQSFLTDITDETGPLDRGRLSLDINDPAHCLDQLTSGVNASSHYHDVDDPRDTTFAMVSMWNAGLRLFDVRDVDHPTEVAYFNPGVFDVPLIDLSGAPLDPLLNLAARRGLDQAWGHVRYLPETGHIWLATRTGGFWVLELEPQVRAVLGLPEVPPAWPNGRPPRPSASRSATTAPRGLGASPALYCTLGRL